MFLVEYGLKSRVATNVHIISQYVGMHHNTDILLVLLSDTPMWTTVR